MKKNYILLFLLTVQLVVHGQTIRRVSTDGVVGNNGSSWSQTMDLQAAVNASAKGDEIWIKAGTYTPSAKYPANQTNDIYNTFILKAGVKIYGGFSGNELLLTDRNVSNPTILSGQQPDNKYSLHVLFANYTHADASDKILLDNIHITNGRNNSSNVSDHTVTGAAIYLASKPNIELNKVEIYNCWANLGSINVPGGATLTIKNNSKFYNNISTGGTSVRGTCIYAVDDATIEIENTIFTDNKQNNTAVSQGGAIFAKADYNNYVTLNINNVKFTNNESNVAGGALRLENNVKATITNSIFNNNKVWPVITNSYNFDDDNSSSRVVEKGGGAILFTANNGPSNSNGWIKIINSSFDSNSSTARGGAIIITASDNSNSYIKNSYFSNNTAEISGAALEYRHSNKNNSDYNQSFLISNNIFYNNSVKYYGAAISVTAACPIIIANNTFYKNAITETSIVTTTSPKREIGGGAAIHFTSSGAYRGDLLRYIVNCIFAANTAPSALENIATAGETSGSPLSSQSATRHTIFVDGNGTTNESDASVVIGSQIGSIFKSTNPNSSHFLRLTPKASVQDYSNPAINGGLNPIKIFNRSTTGATTEADLTFTSDSIDLAGNSRLLENIIDLGAYEAHALSPEVLPVDLISFSIQHIKSGAQLTWKVASETNNEKFIIERSADGESFEIIGHKNSSGNTTNTANYSYTDSKPLNGTSYYRLSQIDLDGTKKILSVKSFNFNLSNNEISIYPVPAKNVLTVKVAQPQNEQISIELFSVTGKKVLSQSFKKQAALQGALLNVSNLTAGVYIVVINNGNTTEKRTISIAK
ncbi:T9SS type A sorting domain-containing protein [Pedobacter sp. UBA4863]|uniref:T9SS type A sorting domain-containing protein n=1 Tax=Pedobacter sp. UBA4863 TaxID=1947060 RepID=UPI0025E56305|nr:T9SS type A sorting domain-containing protein [Pedobacter sp. UBA4863]